MIIPEVLQQLRKKGDTTGTIVAEPALFTVATEVAVVLELAWPLVPDLPQPRSD